MSETHAFVGHDGPFPDDPDNFMCRIDGCHRYSGQLCGKSASDPIHSVRAPCRFRLVKDDDDHAYIIPADRRKDWEAFLDSDDAQDGITPEWANRLSYGHSCYTFTDFREDDDGRE